MVNPEIRKMISMIMDKAIEVSSTTKADVWVEYHPHVQEFEVRVAKDGYEYMKEHITSRLTSYIDSADTYIELTEIYRFLCEIQ